MIDLHLHTTASDGRSTPAALVAEVAAAGIRIIAVTDHDTVAAVAAVSTAAQARGLTVVTGIEITAVYRGRDVHMLGYFIDVTNADLAAFLRRQQDDRRRRVGEIVHRLDRLGVPVDVTAAIGADPRNGRAIGRPLVAAALVEAGHAADVADAFDRYLAEGKPAFVERVGPEPAAVVTHVHEAGGVVSIAHPGTSRADALVPGLVEAGLDAIEAFHPDHDVSAVSHYRDLAARYGLAVTGGSDYHGPSSGRAASLGRVTLPMAAFEALVGRARARHS